jgi:hypothetical protein
MFKKTWTFKVYALWISLPTSYFRSRLQTSPVTLEEMRRTTLIVNEIKLVRNLLREKLGISREIQVHISTGESILKIQGP